MQRPQQILVPFDIKVRVESALHQYASAAEFDRLVDSFADLVYRMDVCVRLSRSPVKRAERADHVADIRVIDIAVDDVGNDIAWIFSLADLIGGKADADEVFRFQKRGAIVSVEPLAVDGFVQYRLYRRTHRLYFNKIQI